MAHLLLIATYICAVPYILQSGLNLTWNPPNIKRARQTLVNPFAEKETKAQRIHWFQIKWQKSALARWFSWLEYCPIHQRLWVRFPVRAHTQVAGLIPSQEATNGYFSLSPFLSKINKHIFG
ncbi:hypothetical protein HJG60_011007 [Phyllostomus discolor]|uniref:Uncharacterized protein n=1 Tax=Phyllostomus discolor TaxID=89673 RepID=A0A834ACD7_9CHIR|nr:hypothetical protein HJG60_011007 [Phyllostomus discolor]